MNKTDATTSSEMMLSKYCLAWRHNPQEHETETCPSEDIHLTEAERQFNVKFHLDIEIKLYLNMVSNRQTSVSDTPISNRRQIYFTIDKNPTRCNSMQSDLFHCKVTLHVSGVTAPIIRITKICNRSLRYRS